MSSDWLQAKTAAEAGDRQAAVAGFRRCVAAEPWWPDHHWSLGMALLASGDYAEGFREIEWRWHPRLNGNEFDRECACRGIPRWSGERGGAVCLYHEWGLGDSIMMLRYAVAARGFSDDVGVVAPAALVPLIQDQGLAAWEFVPDRWFAFCCPLFSLPPLLGLDPRSRSYVVADRNLVAELSEQISKRPKLGIAWSGNRSNVRDADRSIPLETFLQLLGKHDYEIYSLQTTETDEARECAVNVVPLRDFRDTAALMSLMDAVVTVDTAAAHLAGAMGHPNANVMLYHAQYWPWYRGDEWYPTLKRLRQSSAGDWDGTFSQLKLEHASVH